MTAGRVGFNAQLPHICIHCALQAHSQHTDRAVTECSRLWLIIGASGMAPDHVTTVRANHSGHVIEKLPHLPGINVCLKGW